jgi:hypothetical protein
MTEQRPEIPATIAEVVVDLLGEGTELTDEALIAAGAVVRRQQAERHYAYHINAIYGGWIVKELRARHPKITWREIDQMTGIESTSARRWLKVAEEYLANPQGYMERIQAQWRP